MPKKISFLFKLAAAAGLIALAAIAALTLALKIYLPPEKIRGLIAENAQKALKREVRLKGISLGVLRGLVLEGLEISESPDFKAGAFAQVESFQLRIRWAPLLRRKVVVDRIAVEGLELNVVRRADGLFNFSNLASSGGAKTPSAAAGRAKEKPQVALPFELNVRRASLSGRVGYRDASSGDRWEISGLEAKAKDVSLARPFKAELSLRAQHGGSTAKAALSYSGEIDLSGQSSGRVAVKINKLSADLPGIGMSVSGTVKLEGERLDIPDLKGRFSDGPLELALSVKDYAKAPNVDLKARLGQLDLGKLMSAKEAVAGSAQPPAQEAGRKAPKKAPEAPPMKPNASPKRLQDGAAAASPPVKARGEVTVGKLIYSGLLTDETRLEWDLRGITPDLKALGGWAKLHVAGGSFDNEGKAGWRSNLIKALLLPLTLLQKIGSLGGLKVLPDFSHILFTEIAGDYVFQGGVMTIKDFHMLSAAANMTTQGTVDLAAQKLDLLVTVLVGKVAPIGIQVGGTFEKPTTTLRLDKALAQPAQKLAEPALKLFKSIFKK